MSLLDETLAAIFPIDEQYLHQAEAHQLTLTKPPGSLGMLETVGNQLCAIAQQCPPPVPTHPSLIIFAGDHGIYRHHISPWPQAVTLQMASNLAAGGAGGSVLARSMGATMRVIDLGMLTPLPASAGVEDRRICAGTADFTVQPALTIAEARAAIETGISIAHEEISGGANLILPGEVGIGNTTPAAALIAAFTGSDPALVTGRGADAGDEMLLRKQQVVAAGLLRHQKLTDPIELLAALGGLEHAAMVGLYLGAASKNIPIVLDGIIACAAALVTQRLCPEITGYLIAGHVGAEPGIAVAHAQLRLTPLVSLGLRLGEGTGALCAVPLVQGGARILNDMATFDSAAVSDRIDL
ncbi:MAG: nicotinate-nucleotide--dimethylbenzimidazole phosphoribosyltransferase [Propionibacteriaceae bacterium]